MQCASFPYFYINPQFAAGNKSLIMRFKTHLFNKQLLNKLKTKVLSEIRSKRKTSLTTARSRYGKALGNDTRNSTFAEQCAWGQTRRFCNRMPHNYCCQCFRLTENQLPWSRLQTHKLHNVTRRCLTWQEGTELVRSDSMNTQKLLNLQVSRRGKLYAHLRRV